MRWLKTMVSVGVLVLVGINQSLAIDPTTKFLHEQATALAFDDKAEQARDILRKIIDRDPDNYPAYRDYVIYTAWAGHCGEALKLYEPIKHYKNQEPYLVTTIADCMASKQSIKESIAFLENWLARYPDNDDIKDNLADKQETLALEMSPSIDASASANNSDLAGGTPQQQAGNDSIEYIYRLRYTHPIWENLRVYGRFLKIDADDAQLAARDSKRLGVGYSWGITNQISLTQDYSENIRKRNQEGSESSLYTILTYLPHELWEFNLEYATYAEDTTPRALSENMTSDKIGLSWYFHTPAYRYEWFTALSQSNFEKQDQNFHDRTSLFSEVSYGFEMDGPREQRIGIEVSVQDNSFNAAPAIGLPDPSSIPYYNPDSTFEVALVYKLHYTFDSRFPRHVDHFTAYVGSYNEELFENVNFPELETSCTNPVYGISYEQEYQFTKKWSFRAGLGAASRVYDCNREGQYQVNMAVSRKLW